MSNKKVTIATKWEVKVEGNKRSIQLFAAGGRALGLKDNTRWEGGFYCYNNQLTSLEGAPREVGGDFYCDNNQLTSLEGAPKEVGGGFYCYNNQLTSLEGAPKEVGGDFYCHNNQLTSLEGAPKEVGGGFYCDNNQLTSENNKPKTNAKNKDAVLNLISAIMLTKNILFADGIMAHIISSKNNVFKIRIYGKKETSYCVYRNGLFSHGKTVKEAISSLRYKASTRDTSEFKEWKLEDIKPIEDLISAYRSITGACEYGVKSFCESINLADRLKVKEVIKLTVGRYGHEQFKSFEWKN